MPDVSRDLLNECPNCGCRDLFIRKDFPQKIGLSLVIIAALEFLILAARRQNFAWGIVVLLGAAVIDAILYAIVPRITVCYRCRSEFRDHPINPRHSGFDLAVGEK